MLLELRQLSQQKEEIVLFATILTSVAVYNQALNEVFAEQIFSVLLRLILNQSQGDKTLTYSAIPSYQPHISSLGSYCSSSSWSGPQCHPSNPRGVRSDMI
jgi:hypothetical protein